jgi:hypothetical protein
VLVLLGVTVFYVLSPVAVRLGSRQAPEMEVEDIPAERIDALGPEAQAFVAVSERALRDEGFEPAARVTATNLLPNGQCAIVLVVNRTARVSGGVMVAVTTLKGAQPRTQKWISFGTHFSDGTIVETSNLAEVSLLLPRERQQPMSFPEVEDPKALFRIHKARVARIEDRDLVLPPEGEEAAFLVREYAADMRRQIEVGYLEHDQEGPMLRPTWKGAFVMTLKLLPPGRWLVQWSRRRANARLLEDLRIAPTL